mgnify:CR=1 FL=1
MNKQTIAKLNLFLGGTIGRLDENKDYFKGIDISLKSGTKTYSASITAKGEGYAFNNCGINTSISEYDIIKNILEECGKYDGATIVYKERGTNIIIEASDREVKTKQVDSTPDMVNETEVNQSKREYIVRPTHAKELLAELGMLTKEGKLRNDMIRKYNQTDHFVELLLPILKELATQKSVCVLDCGCGKSYLSFVLNFYLREVLKADCRFIGVDYSQQVIDASTAMAKRLGYNNMEFVCADINTYTPKAKVDLLISLHACDVATDMAIALGIRNNVKSIVVVPCCHKEMLSQYSYEPFEPLLRHGIFKARLADTLTDAMRTLYLEGAGYQVNALEYISPLETPKNLMIMALKRQSENSKAKEDYKRLKTALNVSLSLEKLAKI